MSDDLGSSKEGTPGVMSTTRQRQVDNLRQLQAIRHDGVDDEGRPLSADALAELDDDIAALLKLLEGS